MIQRIQSLYLLVGAILQLLFAVNTYFTYKIGEKVFHLNGSGIFNENNEQTDGDMKTFALSLIIAGIAILSIFLFKNRKNQMKIVKVAGLLTLMEIVFLFISYFNISTLEPTSISFGFVIFLLPISSILFFLAAKAIKKDEDLIKSVDRIR